MTSIIKERARAREKDVESADTRVKSTAFGQNPDPSRQENLFWELYRSFKSQPLIVRIIAVLSLIGLFGFLIVKGVKNGVFDPYVKDKVMVVYSMTDTAFTHRQGMFNEFFNVMGSLHYAEIHDAYAVRVDFSEESFYTDPSKGRNWWSYYFQDVMIISRTNEPSPYHDQALYTPWKPFRSSIAQTENKGRPNVEEHPEIHLNSRFSRFGKYGSFTQLIDGPNIDAPHPYPVSHGIPLAEVHNLAAKYIRINAELVSRVDKFLQEKTKPSDVLIGIHYRGTDKIDAYPYRNPPFPIDIYLHYINQHLTREKLGDKFKLVVATDVVEFIEWIESRYPGHVIYWPESTRLSIKVIEGTHKTNKYSAALKGESAIIECLLLSSTKYLIKNRSALSDAALALSDTLYDNFVFLLSDVDPVYIHYQGKSYKEPMPKVTNVTVHFFD